MATVYFDGHCNLCNASVDFLIRLDRRHRLQFASLQGRTAARRLPPDLVREVGTVVFEDARGLVTQSTAVVRAVVALGGLYKTAVILLIIPKWLRDRVYRFVARHRYAWFGRRDVCRVPTADERARFLD